MKPLKPWQITTAAHGPLPCSGRSSRPSKGAPEGPGSEKEDVVAMRGLDIALPAAVQGNLAATLRACEELPRPSHYPWTEGHVLSVVIPSESEGPGGRAAWRPLLSEGCEASPRPGPSLSLGMTGPKFSRGNRAG